MSTILRALQVPLMRCNYCVCIIFATHCYQHLHIILCNHSFPKGGQFIMSSDARSKTSEHVNVDGDGTNNMPKSNTEAIPVLFFHAY